MGRRKRGSVLLIVSAALLIVVGLVSAINAPAGPPRSNKADAYGGPVAPKPTNPKSVNECAKYYGAQNPLPEARECRAIAKKNHALAVCAKKKGAAKTACQKKAKKAFAKEKRAIARQRAAEKACTDKYNADYNALNPDDPDYDTKSQAVSEAFSDCMARARKA
jgi:hypothetical protein